MFQGTCYVGHPPGPVERLRHGGGLPGEHAVRGQPTAPGILQAILGGGGGGLSVLVCVQNP